jgi:hypothetical protein
MIGWMISSSEYATDKVDISSRNGLNGSDCHIPIEDANVGLCDLNESRFSILSPDWQ